MKHKLKKKKIGLIGIGLATAFTGVVAIGCMNNNNIKQVKAESVESNYIQYDIDNNYFYTDLLSYITENPNVNSLITIIDFGENEYNTLFYGEAIQSTNSSFQLVMWDDPSVIAVSYYNGNMCFHDEYSSDWLIGNSIKVYQSYTLDDLTKTTDRDFYSYLVAQVQSRATPTPPTPTQVGSGIIAAITSGLGLISSLATEFLSGFTTLFWNTTANTLTTFGMFALVMLGIAISFAVVKLVLAILRSNTGA